MEFLIGVIRGVIALAVLVGICYLLSANRKEIDWKLVLKGIALQLVLAVAILYVPFIRYFFDIAASFFIVVLDFTEAGSKFLFGNLITDTRTFGYIFVFQVLPTIIFFAALSAVLYYLGILQRIIFGFAWLMKRLMGLSGAESLAAAANVFIGQTEAPLIVKPYLEQMTRSEILCLMTGGMATIAGGVFAAYVGYLSDSFVQIPDMTAEALQGSASAIAEVKQFLAAHIFEVAAEDAKIADITFAVAESRATEIIALGDLLNNETALAASAATLDTARNLFAQHLLMASIISAPAAIVASKLLYPQVDEKDVIQEFKISKDKIGSNLLEAISIGTTDGLKLAVNVGAMLLVFTALVAMVNFILSDIIGHYTHLNPVVQNFAEYLKGQGFNVQEDAMLGLNLEFLLGLIFAPISWLLGVPNKDIFLVGQLLGQKTVINEFFAYAELAKITKTLDIKSLIIVTYALCGFANFASIGIQIGGIGAIAPGQRKTIAEFGIKALIGGTIACFMTAAIAGMLVNADSFILN
ncbi:MAG: CNT family concentrative nucleoside transporter [Saprospiraceae bacterium]|jgi:CNT family concentrative nucleoside transporter